MQGCGSLVLPLYGFLKCFPFGWDRVLESRVHGGFQLLLISLGAAQVACVLIDVSEWKACISCRKHIS